MADVLKHQFVTSYKELKVFQKAYALALEIHKASLDFPKTEQYALADQLRRSSRSVCANIAEGFARQRDSKAEWRRFLLISLGSCEESAMWLDFCRDLSYVNEKQTTLWHNEYEAVMKMLHTLRNS